MEKRNPHRVSITVGEDSNLPNLISFGSTPVSQDTDPAITKTVFTNVRGSKRNSLLYNSVDTPWNRRIGRFKDEKE